jgi:hypothetical protein
VFTNLDRTGHVLNQNLPDQDRHGVSGA